MNSHNFSIPCNILFYACQLGASRLELFGGFRGILKSLFQVEGGPMAIEPVRDGLQFFVYAVLTLVIHGCRNHSDNRHHYKPTDAP